MQKTPGQRFRDAIAAEQPLQVIGAINANHALLAKRAGFKAIYLSGGGVAAGSLGMPPMYVICRYWSISTPALGRAPSISSVRLKV